MLNSRALGIFTALALVTGSIASVEAQPLARYSWKNRLLVIFSPNATVPALARQRRIVNASRAGFRERDMVVIEVVGDTVRSRLGPAPGASAASLRRYYGVGQKQFRTILIGKDGGSKLQRSSAVSATRLFVLIDSMPMRRQEMRSSG